MTADLEGANDGRIIAAVKDGYTKFDPRTGDHEYLCNVWEGQHDAEKAGRFGSSPPSRESTGKLIRHRMRMNDGAVDSQGRFWAGVMNDPKVKLGFEDEGVVFRLDPDLKLHRMIEKTTIPNGIGWNYKDDTMFWTDSTTSKIFKFDFDASTGTITNRQVFFEYVDKPGVPDGFAMDVEGCIWSAVFLGSKVIRISPEGKIIGEISLPTRCPTCPAFVGTSLFITSAKEPDPENFPSSAKYAGNLFRVDVGVRGKPKHKFRIGSAA